mmetsp:Transcript_64901/g.153399  ORF Transcript_64901/g.153399 Transcript_64901/m.153399 type:complete len:298 (+) Transcript_64901:724-1617(+)
MAAACNVHVWDSLAYNGTWHNRRSVRVWRLLLHRWRARQQHRTLRQREMERFGFGYDDQRSSRARQRDCAARTQRDPVPRWELHQRQWQQTVCHRLVLDSWRTIPEYIRLRCVGSGVWPGTGTVAPTSPAITTFSSLFLVSVGLVCICSYRAGGGCHRGCVVVASQEHASCAELVAPPGRAPPHEESHRLLRHVGGIFVGHQRHRTANGCPGGCWGVRESVQGRVEGPNGGGQDARPQWAARDDGDRHPGLLCRGRNDVQLAPPQDCAISRCVHLGPTSVARSRVLWIWFTLSSHSR